MEIQKYKNINSQTLELNDKDLVLFGKNGVGKTNFCDVLAHNLIGYSHTDGKFTFDSEDDKNLVVYVAANRMYKKGENQISVRDSKEIFDELITETLNANYERLIGNCIEEYYNKFVEYSTSAQEIFNEIYPDVYDASRDSKEEKKIYKLSDGHKSIFLIIILLIIQKNLEEKSKVIGKEFDQKIAIIDEIDLNVHFSIQRKIYSTLKKNFKDVKFIITTHSPIFLSSINSKYADIYELKNGLLHQTEDLFIKDIEEIFDDEFDTKMFNEEITELLDQLKLEYIKYIRGEENCILNLLSSIEENDPTLKENIYIRNYFSKVKYE